VRVTRRGLLHRGGASAAVAGAAAAFPGLARAQEPAAAQPEDPRRALLVVLPLVRADHVDAFEGGSGADTPNLGELTGDALRFDRAIPECMPALPVRRTLVTGMRSFPFRDWKRTEGMPGVPGYNPVWDWQPVMTEVMRGGGIKTVYVTDNPIVGGQRFPDVRRPPATPRGGPGASGIEGEIGALRRATQATERTFRAGIGALGEFNDGESFFVAVDPFDPVDAIEAPPIYVRPGEVEREGIGPMSDRLVELDYRDGDTDDLRSAYRDHVEAVDEWVGRLMDEVPDDVLVFALGDIGYALGEHSYIGRGTPTSYRPAYEVPFLIRHPNGDKGGDSVDWYAATHDVAPTLLSHLGLTIPGKMRGEDLMALFDDVDEEDLYDRPASITASGQLIMVRDNRFLLVADREQLERRLYDDDEEADDDIKRYDDVAGDEPGVLTDLSVIALSVAGGTLPEFGPDGALRPLPQRGDDDIDDDGIPNDFDAVDNDELDDSDSPEAQRFDGRDPEDRVGAQPAEPAASARRPR
jgi:arylsulfatase A-like enzyme